MITRELHFDLPAYTLCARAWEPPGGVPVIALHGWLDNAASFARLAPLLPQCHIIALDLAGHGRSGWRSADSGYAIWQDVADVIAVADALGWDRFALLGHSRGAAIAMLTASAFPERITRLAMIEGGMPFAGEPEETPEALAKAISERARVTGRTGRVFATREEAVQERTRGLSPVSVASADLLAQRSLREVDGGWQWHVDPCLKGALDLKLTPAQIEAFVLRVRAPSLIVFAADSPFSAWPAYRRMMPLFADLTELRLPGSHHLHMEGGEVEIARHAGPFLAGDDGTS
jgi:pimeloyl-ACP methyl ester carboxylesterase